jgi:magnesium transporter
MARKKKTPSNPIDLLRTQLRAREWHPARRGLAELHSADVSDLLATLDDEEQLLVFRLLGRRKGEVFAYLPAERQEHILAVARPETLAGIVEHLSADDRTKVLGDLPPEIAHALLARLPASEARASLTLLSYPEDTAGRFMTPDYAWVRPTMTAAEAIDHLRKTGRSKETLNVVYIVDERGFLVEDVRLGALVLAAPATVVTEIPDPPVVWMLDTLPREEVVRLFEKYDRVAMPVVDAQQRMLGIITVDDILDVAEAEATEDIQKIGGLDALDAPYLNVGFADMLRKRGGWLAVLFVGEMLTATAMGHFEAEIAQAVVLALFVPLIISSGGNSGSQAASLIIRALALKELTLADWWRVMRRELYSGVALGGGLGAIGFARIVLWQKLGVNAYGPHYLLVAATVWLSLVGVVTFGTLCGSMLPFLMRRLGLDPATSSAPFVATLVDVTGLVIYFRLAGLILRGTLL